MILSLGTWIHFHDVNLSILSTLCQQMKITEIIHIIFSLIVHQTTYQGPRVSVDVSGNLILCCEPQICCLALRAASHILGEPKGGFLLLEERGPIRMGVRRASLGVSPPRMAEGWRYYAVS